MFQNRNRLYSEGLFICQLSLIVMPPCVCVPWPEVLSVAEGARCGRSDISLLERTPVLHRSRHRAQQRLAKRFTPASKRQIAGNKVLWQMGTTNQGAVSLVKWPHCPSSSIRENIYSSSSSLMTSTTWLLLITVANSQHANVALSMWVTIFTFNNHVKQSWKCR